MRRKKVKDEQGEERKKGVRSDGEKWREKSRTASLKQVLQGPIVL